MQTWNSGVYLLHFEPAYQHARHYLGYADDIARRIEQHRSGQGARLTQVAVQAGCDLVLVRTWRGEDRQTERRLKNRKSSPALCPICNPLRAPLFDALLDFTLADVEELEF